MVVLGGDPHGKWDLAVAVVIEDELATLKDA
jgi:hypothetical protein